MEKNIIRKDIIEKRNKLDKGYIINASQSVIDTVLGLARFQEAKVVLSYMPFKNEVDIMPLNQMILDKDAILCIPRTIDRFKMDAVNIKNLQSNLIKSRFGVVEPATSAKAIDIEKIDLVLVPGVAFDKEGNRIGYGKGYYDRFLEQCNDNTEFWGIAYSFQVFDRIPHTPSDVRLNRVITESPLHVL